MTVPYPGIINRRGKVITAISIAVLLGASAGAWQVFARDGGKFEGSRWRAVGANVNCRDTTRYVMADDVVANQLRIGMTSLEARALLGLPSGIQRFPDRGAAESDRWELRHAAALGETRDEARHRIAEGYRREYGIARLPRIGYAMYWNLGRFDTTCFSVLARFRSDDKLAWKSGPF